MGNKFKVGDTVILKSSVRASWDNIFTPNKTEGDPKARYYTITEVQDKWKYRVAEVKYYPSGKEDGEGWLVEGWFEKVKMPKKKVTKKKTNPNVIHKLSELPIGRIGRVVGEADLYIARFTTSETLRIWLNSKEPIESLKDDWDWEVELLPIGATLTIAFNGEDGYGPRKA